jgi:hypothetical protein
MATYSEFPSTYILLVLKTYEDAIFSSLNKCEMFAQRVLFIDLLLK